VIAGALGYSTVKMARDYFVTWARDPGLFTAFDVGLRESAEYLASLPGDELISLSPVDRDLPILRFTFRDDVSRLKTFNGRRCAVYPIEPTRDWTHVSIVAEERHSLDVIQRVFPSGHIVKEFADFRVLAGRRAWNVGTPYSIAYRVSAGSRAQTPLDEAAVFGDGIALVNSGTFRTSETPKVSVRAGETLSITLAWKSLAAVSVNYTIFVHLAPALDAPRLRVVPNDTIVAQEDAQPCDNSYPTTWWSPGEIIEEDRRIVIPADTLPGQYVLTTGVYELATGKRLPMFANSEPPGDQFVLGTVNITR
jgi:hypothetical protein